STKGPGFRGPSREASPRRSRPWISSFGPCRSGATGRPLQGTVCCVGLVVACKMCGVPSLEADLSDVEPVLSAPAVRLEHVVKRFGDVIAVDGVDLQVREGEFFSMLGPSGSGKTTCLRMIAGFEQPTEGRILLGGTDVSGLPPYQRDVNTVFQDYALFPHMTVAQNVAYGLMIRKVSKADRTARVNQALEMV